MEAPEIESRQMFALLLSNCKQLDVEAVQMRLREEDFSDAILLRTEGRRSFQAQIVDPVYDPDRRKLILPDVPRLRPVRPRLKRRLPVTLSGRMTRLRDLRLGKELWFDAVVSDLSCSGVSVRFVRPSPLIQVGDNVRVELELSSGRVWPPLELLGFKQALLLRKLAWHL